MAKVLLRVQAIERWFIFPPRLNSVSALPWEIRKVIISNEIKNKRQRLCLVSAAVSKMGVAGLFFVETGIKVDGKYSQDVLLSQQMIPVIRHVAGDNFVFHQDSAPAHRARDTVELLQCETADFISPELWPPTVRT